MSLHRTLIDRVTRVLAIVLAVAPLALFLFSPSAYAQEPPDEPGVPIPPVNLPFLRTLPVTAPPEHASANGNQRHNSVPLQLLVDTDPGVDDAIALTWLLSQRKVPVQLLGVVTVAGNTDVYNATNNVLNVLTRLQIGDVPVVVGAAMPITQTLSKTSWFIHGPDGLWFHGANSPIFPNGVSSYDAVTFYCTTIAAHPGATLLALGPLTNVANAIRSCPPGTMETLGSVIVLGGAKFGGNKTPVAEFNFWQDPEAAHIVLSAGLPLNIVPLDSFTTPTVDLKDVEKLFGSRNPAVSFLAPALQQYVTVQLQNTGKATIPDAVAAAYTLDPGIGTAQEALVKMVLEPGQTRGASVVGISFSERISMIADDAELSALAASAFTVPGFNLDAALGTIYVREPANAFIVTGTSKKLLTKLILPDLRK
ncbi:MAG: nucleoside hydrolase [Tetrasphaera sp.]